MAIRRCFKVIFFEPHKDASHNDYFLFKHYSGFWMVWKNTFASEKYECDSLKEAFKHATMNAGLRGCNLWLSLDEGTTWEKHKPEDFEDPKLIKRCV
jgi:hypothetical protein